MTEAEHLKDLLGRIKWKGADKDNMEFSALITYSLMDAILEALKEQECPK